MAVVFKSKYGIPIEQNSWKWFSDKKFTLPVWFTRTQLPPTVMKRSQRQNTEKEFIFK